MRAETTLSGTLSTAGLLRCIMRLFTVVALVGLVQGAFAQARTWPIPYDAGRQTNVEPLSTRTKYVDQWGYPISIDADIERLGSFVSHQCGSNFILYFEDEIRQYNKGFNDQTNVTLPAGHPLGGGTIVTLGALRRWTACKVFEYIATIIEIPGGAAPDVFFTESETDATDALGMATVPYPLPPHYGGMGPISMTGLLSSGLLYKHITTGSDPSPLPGEYDAIITMDFGDWFVNGMNRPFNNDAFTPTTGSGIDLFSVILHQATHSLGFISMVRQDGNSSQTGTSPGVYTHFDQFLFDNQPEPLLHNSIAFNGSVTLTSLTENQLVYAHPDNTENYSLHSKAPWVNGCTLSHFSDERDRHAYLMQPGHRLEQRIYTVAELAVFCNIGYTLTQDVIDHRFSCGDRYALGVGETHQASSMTAPVTIDLLANGDNDPDGQAIALESTTVELLTPKAGTISVNAATNEVTFKPNGMHWGAVVIRYRPYTVDNGYPGTWATLTIVIPSSGVCPGDPCNSICNGSLENGSIPTESNHATGLTPTPHPNLPGWWDVVPSFDYFHRDALLTSMVGIPIHLYNAIQPGIETHTGPGTGNNAYIGGIANGYSNGVFEAGECFGVDLVAPLTAGTYVLTVWARATRYSATAQGGTRLSATLCATRPTMDQSTYFSTGSPDIEDLPGTWFSNTGPNNMWTRLRFELVASGGEQFLLIQPYGLDPTTITYIYYDDFRLVPIAVEHDLSISIVADRDQPKPGEVVTFTIKVCNNDATPSNSIAIQNVLPPGFALVSSNFNGPYPNHTFATIPAGGCVQLQVRAIAQAGVAFNTTLSDCVSITTTSACASTACAQLQVPATNIALSSDEVDCNTWQLTAVNNGPIDAHNVKIAYTPPSCYAANLPTPPSGTTYAGGIWTIPLLRTGSQLSMDVSGTATVNCSITAALSGTYDEWDMLNSDNSTSTIIGGPGNDAAGTSQTICAGASVRLGAAPALAQYTYSWTSSPAGFTSTQAQPMVSPLVTTTYTLITSTTGCSYTSSVTITVDAAAPNCITVYKCSGENYDLSTLFADATLSYTWPNGNSQVAAGTYSITVTNAACNLSKSICIKVENYLGPGLPSTLTVSVCKDQALYDLTKDFNDPLFTYTWPNGSPLVASDATYTVYSSNSCGKRSSCTVIVQAATTASSSAVTPTITPSGTIPLTVTNGLPASYLLTGSSGAASYRWLFNGVGIPGATQSSYTIAPLNAAASGAYQLEATYNNGGCAVSAGTTVNVTVH